MRCCCLVCRSEIPDWRKWEDGPVCSLKCQVVWEGMTLVERVPAVYRDPGRFEMIRRGLASGVIRPDARGEIAWARKFDVMDLPACSHFSDKQNEVELKKRCDECKLWRLSLREIVYETAAAS